jgi:hypothetical protein
MIIRTQSEWESVRGRFSSASAYRSFIREFTFDPNSRLTATGRAIRDALPRAREGGPRWKIFESIRSGMTVAELNQVARSFRHSEHDADLFIALFKGFVRFQED